MNLAKKLSIAAAGIALGFASVSVPSSAQAAQLFDFNYSFPEDILGLFPAISAAGTLTTTDLNPVDNTYTITGITGTRTFGGVQKNILGLLAPGSFGYSDLKNDNLLYANAPFLSDRGFAFTVDGNISVNVFYFGSGDFSDLDSKPGGNYGSSFNVTNVTNNQPVPEPTTIAGSLAVGAGIVMSRLKKRKLEKAS